MDSPLQFEIVGLYRDCETGVGVGVLVRAIDQRFIRPRHDLLQRAPHLLGRAFEQAAAPHRKQRIADEGDLRLRQVVDDVAPRMPGRVVDSHDM